MENMFYLLNENHDHQNVADIHEIYDLMHIKVKRKILFLQRVDTSAIFFFQRSSNLNLAFCLKILHVTGV